MTGDDRMTWELILEIFDVLERHGYHQHDNQHTGQAVGVIFDLARVYDGTRDVPYGSYPGHAQPGPPVPGAGQDAVTLSHADVSTVSAALDIAAACKRARAEKCADCPDQSCPACQTRLQDALTYDQMTGRLLRTAEAARTSDARQPEPASPSISPGQVHTSAEMEAG